MSSAKTHSCPVCAGPFGLRGREEIQPLMMVLLQGGIMHLSFSDDMKDTITELLRPIVARAFSGNLEAVPATPGFYMGGAASAAACVFSVFHERLCTAAGATLVPVVTFGVAGNTDEGDALWRRLHEVPGASDLTTDPMNPPPVAWCGIRLEDSMAGVASRDRAWLAEITRAVAWTRLTMLCEAA